MTTPKSEYHRLQISSGPTIRVRLDWWTHRKQTEKHSPTPHKTIHQIRAYGNEGHLPSTPPQERFGPALHPWAKPPRIINIFPGNKNKTRVEKNKGWETVLNTAGNTEQHTFWFLISFYSHKTAALHCLTRQLHISTSGLYTPKSHSLLSSVQASNFLA